MKVQISETGKIEYLNITDPKSGCDWTQDLLGNHGALPEYDDDTDTYLMSQDDFDWWSDLVDRYQEADDRYYEICRELDENERSEFEDIVSSHCGGVDLETHPDALQQACDEWEQLQDDAD